MFGKASKSTIEKSLPALPTPPYNISGLLDVLKRIFVSVHTSRELLALCMEIHGGSAILHLSKFIPLSDFTIRRMPSALLLGGLSSALHRRLLLGETFDPTSSEISDAAKI
jgi:hypothetical protein